MTASAQVRFRRFFSLLPRRSEFCPRTGASRAMNRPAIVVEMASDWEVWFSEPNDAEVMYTLKTKVVMTVLNGWVPQSHIAHEMIFLFEAGAAVDSAVVVMSAEGSASAPTGWKGVLLVLTERNLAERRGLVRDPPI